MAGSCEPLGSIKGKKFVDRLATASFSRTLFNGDSCADYGIVDFYILYEI